MKNGILFLALLFLTSCATEEKKPEAQWQVKVTKEGEKKVWVWKSDGSKQCDAPAKLSPSRAAQDLKQSGVLVYQYRSGNDGMMYPSVCGAGTGATVELEISQNDLLKALKAGFKAK